MQAIFLDLDGTLIDPKEGITLSIQHALKELGADDIPSQNELTWCIGPPLRSSFEVLLGDGADVEQAIAYYRERYSEEGIYEAEPYDGIGEMLDDLRDLSPAVWIATSKARVYAQTIADHFGISNYIDGVFGSELSGELSDKSELLTHALNETGADPAQCFMLGDRRFDIFGARNNDIPSIGALWGYAEEGELHMAEADGLAGEPEEVPEIAADLLGLEL